MDIIQSTLKDIGYTPKTERIGGNSCVTMVLNRMGYYPTIAQAEGLWCKILTMLSMESHDWTDVVEECMGAPASASTYLDTAEREILTDAVCRLMTGYPHMPGQETPENLRKMTVHILCVKLDDLGISKTPLEE